MRHLKTTIKINRVLFAFIQIIKFARSTGCKSWISNQTSELRSNDLTLAQRTHSRLKWNQSDSDWRRRIVLYGINGLMQANSGNSQFTNLGNDLSLHQSVLNLPGKMIRMTASFNRNPFFHRISNFYRMYLHAGIYWVTAAVGDSCFISKHKPTFHRCLFCF